RNGGSRRWVLSPKQLGSTNVTTKPCVIHPDCARTNIEQMHTLIKHLAGRELLQRGDVIKNIDTTSVSSDNQITVTRMDQDVINSDGWHTRHQWLPFATTVERNKEPKFSAHKQEILTLGVFGNNVDRSPRGEVV